MSDVDHTPAPGSFLWAVAQAHPNDPVTVGQHRGTAGAVARDVEQMLAEIAALRTDRDRWQGIAVKLTEAAR